MDGETRLARFLALDWSDRLLLARFALAACLAKPDLERPRQFEPGNADRASAAQREEAERLARLVNIAVGVSSGPKNCLLRSVMLSRELARRSIPHEVCLGARQDLPGQLAHAWVEVSGAPVNDTQANVSGFARFRDRPSSAAKGAFRAAPGVLVSRNAEGAVLLDEASGEYFGLDPVGTRFWELIGEGLTTRAASETIAREYEVPVAAVERDLDELLRELRGSGLIEAA